MYMIHDYENIYIKLSFNFNCIDMDVLRFMPYVAHSIKNRCFIK